MRCQKCLYNIYTESMAHSPSSTWVPLDSWSHWNLQVILSYINPTTDCENTSTAPIKSEPLQIVPVSCNHYYMCLTTGCMWNRYSSCNCERTPLVEHKNKTSTLAYFQPVSAFNCWQTHASFHCCTCITWVPFESPGHRFMGVDRNSTYICVKASPLVTLLWN